MASRGELLERVNRRDLEKESKRDFDEGMIAGKREMENKSV